MVIFDDGTVNLSNGSLRTALIDHTHGGTFNFTGGTLSVNTFDGNLVSNGGTLAPGGTPGDADTIGTTTVSGNYTQDASATLALGTNSDGNFDRFVVNGHLELHGALVVSDDEGFFIAIGQHFDLLDWGTLGGTFETVTLFDISIFNGVGWNTEDLYTTGEISFELEGDLNTDGFVGAADLDIVLANWNQTTLEYDYAAGDVSGDGVVDGADLALIQANFGNGTLPGPIPEPGTLAGWRCCCFARRGVGGVRR